MARDLVPLTSLSATLGLLLVLVAAGRQGPAVLAGAAMPHAQAAPLDVQTSARVCLPLILHQHTAGSAVCYDQGACDPASYCRRPVGVCTGPGRCERRPDACTADWAPVGGRWPDAGPADWTPVGGRWPDAGPADWTPVCGCDGRTYSNACTAAAAGETVAYEGECTGR